MEVNFLDFRADVLITSRLITEQRRDVKALNPWLTFRVGGGRGGGVEASSNSTWNIQSGAHTPKERFLGAVSAQSFCFHEYIFHAQSITRLYTHTHTQQTMSHLWQCEARDLIARTSNVWFSRWKFLCLVFDGAAAVPPGRLPGSSLSGTEWWVMGRV